MEEKKDKKKILKAKAAIEFTGIGMQMLVTILLFFYLGEWLDERNPAVQSNWILWLTLTGVFVALYFMIKGLIRLTS